MVVLDQTKYQLKKEKKSIRHLVGRAKAGRPARTYIQQLCEDTGCCSEDLPEAMNDREKWQARVRDIRATSSTWWWWWVLVTEKKRLVEFPWCNGKQAGLRRSREFEPHSSYYVQFRATTLGKCMDLFSQHL